MRVSNADRACAEIQNAFFDIGRAVTNPRQPATIKILTKEGWRQKRTTLANARAWRNYFLRRFPGATTELIIHVGENHA